MSVEGRSSRHIEGQDGPPAPCMDNGYLRQQDKHSPDDDLDKD